LRTISCFAVFVMLSPVGILAQTASPVAPVPAPPAVQGPDGQTELAFAPGTVHAGLFPAMLRADSPSLRALPSRSGRPDDMAFLKAAPRGGSERNAMRDKVAPVILSLAVHAAVTWDAQSTNHFFHHYPDGFRPAEADPLMRPFAGKALMYPVSNLLFAAPIDLLLLKTRHDRKPIRILTYTAASMWAGLEMRQSIVNIRNEHVSLATGAEAAKAIARTN